MSKFKFLLSGYCKNLISLSIAEGVNYHVNGLERASYEVLCGLFNIENSIDPGIHFILNSDKNSGSTERFKIGVH